MQPNHDKDFYKTHTVIRRRRANKYFNLYSGFYYIRRLFRELIENLREINRSDNTIKIYVELFDEGTPTFIATKAEKLDNGLYKVLSTPNYDPEDTIWAFPPGSVVRLEIAKNLRGEPWLAHYPNPNIIRIEIEKPDKIPFIVSTFAEGLGGDLYKVLAQTNYNEKEHGSKFPPGSIVRLTEKDWGHDLGTYLTPTERVR